MYADGEDLIEDFEKKIELLKYQYDLILIDTYVEEQMKWNARLAQIADCIIFVVGSSYFENLKAQQLWEKNRFLLDRKKTKLLFNRYSKYSLYKTRLLQNFHNFEVLGFVPERKYYAQNINLSHPNHYGGILEKREYKKIVNRIFHPEKMSEGERLK